MRNFSPFDLLATDYDRWFDEKDGKIIFASEVKACKEVLPMLPRPWLEIGVGSGRFAEALGIKTGMDPSGSILEKARGRGIMTVKGKIEEGILPLESFGAVFLLMTLCFLDNPGAALAEIHRILKPGGKLVLGEVQAHSAWGKLYRNKKKAGHPFYKYANFYTYAELKLLLKNAGFSIDTTISTLLQKPDNLIAIEDPCTGYKKNAGFLLIAASKISNPR